MLVRMPSDLVRVGRWMSQTEYDLLVKTAQVQESRSGTTHVAFSADQAAFQAQVKPGSLYVEFDVSASSVKPTQQGWAKILGPSSLEGRQAIRAGKPALEMPDAWNIQHCATK
jgi:hypothetical protein